MRKYLVLSRSCNQRVYDNKINFKIDEVHFTPHPLHVQCLSTIIHQGFGLSLEDRNPKIWNFHLAFPNRQDDIHHNPHLHHCPPLWRPRRRHSRPLPLPSRHPQNAPTVLIRLPRLWRLHRNLPGRRLRNHRFRARSSIVLLHIRILEIVPLSQTASKTDYGRRAGVERMGGTH